jgi:hypothetical protein
MPGQNKKITEGKYYNKTKILFLWVVVIISNNQEEKVRN